MRNDVLKVRGVWHVAMCVNVMDKFAITSPVNAIVRKVSNVTTVVLLVRLYFKIRIFPTPSQSENDIWFQLKQENDMKLFASLH